MIYQNAYQRIINNYTYSNQKALQKTTISGKEDRTHSDSYQNNERISNNSCSGKDNLTRTLLYDSRERV